MKKSTHFINVFTSLFFVCSALMPDYLLSQGTAINTDGSLPHTSAIVDIKSDGKGILVPRMSTINRTGIATPAEGLMVYDTDTDSFWFYNGSAWQEIRKGNVSEIADADNNTKVQVEASADEDTIRFNVNGVQQLRLDGKMAHLEAPGKSLFLGYNAGKNDDGTNNFNVFIGHESGRINTAGINNTFIGYRSGDVNNGDDNTFVGRDAGGQSTTGDNNTFLGSGTGDANVGGNANTFLGQNAGGSNVSGSFNTFVGQSAGDINTADNNTFIGRDAGGANTTGTANTFIGQGAGDINNANDNTFVGKDAGGANTIGAVNTFVGKDAGLANTSGTGNTFIGKDAGLLNVTGNSNTFIGQGAGDINTASNNTFIGKDAGGANTAGTSNTFVGQGAGDVNTAGSNTFIGKDAGGSNTGGSLNTFIGDGSGMANGIGANNTFVGQNSGVANIDGNSNTFIGYLAGDANTTADLNTFIGKDAGSLTTTGGTNTFIGFAAGAANVGGESITCVGRDADVNNTSLLNATALGNATIVTANNKVRIGNGSVITIEGQVAYSFPSDGRFKFNVQENIPGLSFIEKLRPVSYQFDLASFNEHVSPQGWEERLDEKEKTRLHQDEIDRSKVIHSGFIAQEVEATANAIGYDFHGIVKPQNPKDNYGIRYAEFTVPLVKAVQELNAENVMLKSQVNALLDQFEVLRKEIDVLKGGLDHHLVKSN